MPITFFGNRHGIGSDNPQAALIVHFRVTNSIQAPVANTPVRARVRYGNMRIVGGSGATDHNGEGSVLLQGTPATGNYDLLVVSVAEQTETTPIVLYNPAMRARVNILNATEVNGVFQMSMPAIMAAGLQVSVTLEQTALPIDNVFIVMRSFYQYRIPQQPGNRFNFTIPPAINGVHIITPGLYNIFYGLNTAQGNIYVADVTTLSVAGAPTPTLLPLRLITQGGEYINALDNLICINPIIPGGQQPSIAMGDIWRVFYSTVEPVQPNSPFILMREGVVDTFGPIQFQTTPNYFPLVTNVPIWMWYSITKPNGSILTSVPIRRILSTL